MDERIIIYIFAALSAALALALLIFALLQKRRQKKAVEKAVYEVNDAKNSTLLSFPLPMAAFRLDDSKIIWGNDMFFSIAGEGVTRLDSKISDICPEFSGKWLLEGKTQFPSLLLAGGRKYRVLGNIIRRSAEEAERSETYMGICYWLDVTEYDDTRIEYEQSRPCAAVILIDNLDELNKNQPDRVRNELLEAVGEKLQDWARERGGLVRRYDRDRFIAVLEKRELEKLKEEKFPILEEIHSIENPNGIHATLSIGFGEDSAGFSEALQYADMANELALTRGGDQAVIKNRLSFEFFGGRGSEVEKRTKVKSRVMAGTLSELISDSSKVLVMGHKYSDLDSIGAAVGVCCLARKLGVNASIVVDEGNTAAKPLIDRMKKENEYKFSFITPQDGLLRADGRTLLVVVDTNRPEQTEDVDLLECCKRVAVIDHHRVAATYIQNAALGFIEPYASSAAELVTEILQETMEKNDILKCEAEALLSGITLDTKNFTIRTGVRTFDAASFLRQEGADTTDVKKLQQSDMKDTIAKYSILQATELYRCVAISVPTTPQDRVVAAKAADEMLNISGVDASIVIAPGMNGGVFASARSIGELNVQIIMEKLGGGGNRSAAAVQFAQITLEEAVEKVYRAIDEYLG